LTILPPEAWPVGALSTILVLYVLDVFLAVATNRVLLSLWVTRPLIASAAVFGLEAEVADVRPADRDTVVAPGGLPPSVVLFFQIPVP